MSLSNEEITAKRRKLGEDLIKLSKDALGLINNYLDEIGLPEDAINRFYIEYHSDSALNEFDQKFEAEASFYDRETKKSKYLFNAVRWENEGMTRHEFLSFMRPYIGENAEEKSE